jgi:hypothetical protein
MLDLNEAWRREVGSSRECLKVFAMCIECPLELERHGGGGFYSPPRESSRWGVRNPDLSDQPLWNPAWVPDMSSLGLSRRGNLVLGSTELLELK